VHATCVCESVKDLYIIPTTMSSRATLLVVAVSLVTCTDAMRVATSIHAKRNATSLDHASAKTSALAKRMAAEEFVSLLGESFCDGGSGSFEYKGVSGTCSLKCGRRGADTGPKYTGPVEGIGSGAHGVTVIMRKNSPSGEKVVAKLFKGAKDQENLNHECDILETLEEAGLKDGSVLRCAGRCENNGYPMIIVEPFLEGRDSFIGSISESYFTSSEAAHAALVSMMKTAMAMLSAGVANIDQGHNMLWSKDGKVTFIDMGLASDLRVELDYMITYHVKRFVEHMFDKIPPAWYKDSRYGDVMSAVHLPTTPPDVAARGPLQGADVDMAAYVQEVKAEREKKYGAISPGAPFKGGVAPDGKKVVPESKARLAAYVSGSKVLYLSTTHKRWMPATILKRNPFGQGGYELNIKRGATVFADKLKPADEDFADKLRPSINDELDYRVGSKVLYWSQTYNDWLRATIVKIDPSGLGGYELDIKQGATVFAHQLKRAD